MLFSSITFLYYFLPCVIGLYFIMPKKYKNLILFISSMVFYFYGEPTYVFLMIFSILISYLFGIAFSKIEKKENKKYLVIIAVSIHVFLLGLFKYSDFVILNVNNLLNTKIGLLELALPIGISFYTFQNISYVIDVYRGNAKVQKSFLKLATYISLFPQLVAGPIVRYETIEKELEERKSTISDISEGIRRFLIGVAKKVLIANQFGQLCQIFMQSTQKSVVFYWIYGIAFCIQIYFDFSGYSDMAIGLGRIFGFHFPENFNYPYISKSITEFWRRWHISLGTWFRDYIYIPLGGNRVSKIKWIRNILIVWALTGFWHGANWNFIVWGLFFAILLVLEKIVLNKFLEKIPSFISRIYVLFLIMISFIIFNASNIGEAFQTIIGLFGLNCREFINVETLYYLKSYFILLIISIIGATPLLKNLIIKLKENKKIEKIINLLEPIYLIILMVLVTGYLVDNSFNPFLYFRF